MSSASWRGSRLRSARPRDLVQLRAALALLPGLQALLEEIDSPLLVTLRARMGSHPDTALLLRRAIADQPPISCATAASSPRGYDAELDELRQIGTRTEEFLLDLERRERERTGITSLRLGYNRVQGFYIEVSRSQAERVPADYLRRQTVKSAERFITPELKGFEDKVLGARERSLARERELYDAVLSSLIAELAPLQATAAALATLDVLDESRRARRDAALVEAGARRGYAP